MISDPPRGKFWRVPRYRSIENDHLRVAIRGCVNEAFPETDVRFHGVAMLLRHKELQKVQLQQESAATQAGTATQAGAATQEGAAAQGGGRHRAAPAEVRQEDGAAEHIAGEAADDDDAGPD
eukprot:TRINITY_DN41488_c0_g1_i2.p2 TRINITY_DN41488_c0_g1~~TRINITY_DN41488_c0_g1_i2.p2  ORF type:complete len:122 (-),score=25.82 TRINITY_DN41488_c0_g1_i2:172-537(-)